VLIIVGIIGGGLGGLLVIIGGIIGLILEIV
jgi:hypothetical protein